jgi:hypothetical protein
MTTHLLSGTTAHLAAFFTSSHCAIDSISVLRTSRSSVVSASAAATSSRRSATVCTGTTVGGRRRTMPASAAESTR